MTRYSILRAIATGATGIVLATTVGVVGASNTQGDEHHSKDKTGNSTTVTTKNDVDATNTTQQTANSGDATVTGSTSKGHGDENTGDKQSDPSTSNMATTGNARNSSESTLGVTITAPSCGCTTGTTTP